MSGISKPRRALLEAIVTYGGTLKATQLTVPDRRLATRLQSDGLVEWFGGSSRHSCIGQSVRITEAGLAVLTPADGGKA